MSQLAQQLADELYEAMRSRRTVAPLRTRYPELDIDGAYAISLKFLERRLAAGERLVGKKIGVTSKPVQDMLGVDRPDFGFLTDAMLVANGGAVHIASTMIAPRAEAEVAFILRHDLSGPDVTAQDVLDATEAVAPCFEIVDSRIANWDIKIVDTVADNASCGVFVLGDARVDPRTLDLAKVHCRVRRNGEFLSEGYGEAVQGSPLNAVAWLANTLGSYGVRLLAGEIILSGSMVPLQPAAAGDSFEMEVSGLGGAAVTFT